MVERDRHYWSRLGLALLCMPSHLIYVAGLRPGRFETRLWRVRTALQDAGAVKEQKRQLLEFRDYFGLHCSDAFYYGVLHEVRDYDGSCAADVQRHVDRELFRVQPVRFLHRTDRHLELSLMGGAWLVFGLVAKRNVVRAVAFWPSWCNFFFMYGGHRPAYAEELLGL